MRKDDAREEQMATPRERPCVQETDVELSIVVHREGQAEGNVRRLADRPEPSIRAKVQRWLRGIVNFPEPPRVAHDTAEHQVPAKR